MEHPSKQDFIKSIGDFIKMIRVGTMKNYYVTEDGVKRMYGIWIVGVEAFKGKPAIKPNDRVRPSIVALPTGILEKYKQF